MTGDMLRTVYPLHQVFSFRQNRNIGSWVYLGQCFRSLPVGPLSHGAWLTQRAASTRSAAEIMRVVLNEVSRQSAFLYHVHTG
jgi:hypothetical protein